MIEVTIRIGFALLVAVDVWDVHIGARFGGHAARGGKTAINPRSGSSSISVAHVIRKTRDRNSAPWPDDARTDSTRAGGLDWC